MSANILSTAAQLNEQMEQLHIEKVCNRQMATRYLAAHSMLLVKSDDL